MRSCLGESFRDDGGLLEFNAEAQMDQRMKEACTVVGYLRWIQAVGHVLTCVHPCQHIISKFVTPQHVLIDDGLPSLLVDFLLEENEKVRVVFLVPKVVVIFGVIV